MNLIDVKDRVKCSLTADITAVQTILPVGPGSQDFQAAAGRATLAVLRDAEHSEVVLVTGVDFGLLTVERGQDGSTPRAFKLGALVSMRPVESTLAQYQQKGVMRQVAYNPNGALMPAYFGEKVAETGVEGCAHRVWQNVVAEAAQWRIVYGEMCEDLTNWREWNWAALNLNWSEWPFVYVDACGWSQADMATVSEESFGLIGLFRACQVQGGAVEYWPDESNTGNGLTSRTENNPLGEDDVVVFSWVG